MSLNFTMVAFLGVIASAVTLFAIGHPAGEAPPSATTRGLIKVEAPVVATAAPSVAAPGFTLVSTSIELPVSDRIFPAGPGVAAAQANCVACHSADMVLNQPALTHVAWEGEVNKMQAIYKAPVAAEDIQTIVDYLASSKSAK